MMFVGVPASWPVHVRTNMPEFPRCGGHGVDEGDSGVEAGDRVGQGRPLSPGTPELAREYPEMKPYTLNPKL